MVKGIHHITAISSNIIKTLEFYENILGLRLVKKTVNFDSPDTYHLYFADKKGTPGTVVTFFPFEDAGTGMRGTEQVTKISFAINQNAIGFWLERFIQFGVKHQKISKQFDQTNLIFFDPDGLQLELIATNEVQNKDSWTNSAIDITNAIKGIYSATLSVDKLDEEYKYLLEEILDYKFKTKEGNLSRFENLNAEVAKYIDIFEMNGWPKGIISAGTVHHIAFRVENIEEQLKLREKILQKNYIVTDVQERNYFKSIYFRDNNNILLEIATDSPGFLIDESIDELGTNLMLPPWLEKYRERIEDQLPKITLHDNVEDESDYKFKFIRKESKSLLILLHGTGGDENDLVNVAEEIDAKSSILSIRGNISENGMLRFFERYPDGTFNLEDLNFRTKQINQFIESFLEKEGFEKEHIIFVGFSNGANLIQNIVSSFKGYKSVILFHPSPIQKKFENLNRKDLKLFLTFGENDQLVTEEDFNEIVKLFNDAGAEVTTFKSNDGHSLAFTEIEEAQKFMNSVKA